MHFWLSGKLNIFPQHHLIKWLEYIDKLIIKCIILNGLSRNHCKLFFIEVPLQLLHQVFVCLCVYLFFLYYFTTELWAYFLFFALFFTCLMYHIVNYNSCFIYCSSYLCYIPMISLLWVMMTEVLEDKPLTQFPLIKAGIACCPMKF